MLTALNDARPLRRRLVPTLLAAAMAMTSLAAISCSSSGTMLDPARRAQAVPVDDDAYAALGYRLQWRGFPRMTPGGQVRFFNVMGDIIGVQESSSMISLIDARSGALRWSDQLAYPLTKFVGITRDETRMISSSETDAFFLAIETGTLVNKHRLERVVTTPPLMAGDVMIYGTATGEVLGILKEHGFRLWGNAVSGFVEAPPIFVGEYVAIVSQTGEILFLDPATGSGIARNKISGGVFSPGGRLAASDTTLFVASLDQSLYAFDARSGALLWRKRTDTPIRSIPVYHDGVVYLDTPKQGLTAYDASTGRELWSARDVAGTVVAVRNGRLVVWDRPSETAATLDPASGEVIDRVRLRGVAFLEPDRFVDGNLFTASLNGVVSKFVPRN